MFPPFQIDIPSIPQFCRLYPYLESHGDGHSCAPPLASSRSKLAPCRAKRARFEHCETEINLRLMTQKSVLTNKIRICLLETSYLYMYISICVCKWYKYLVYLCIHAWMLVVRNWLPEEVGCLSATIDTCPVAIYKSIRRNLDLWICRSWTETLLFFACLLNTLGFPRKAFWTKAFQKGRKDFFCIYLFYIESIIYNLLYIYILYNLLYI